MHSLYQVRAVRLRPWTNGANKNMMHHVLEDVLIGPAWSSNQLSEQQQETEQLPMIDFTRSARSSP
ncbi:hypothetical protein ACNFH5_17560 [Pseudomonas sp. NY15435]|uniref:hypothetical protein n=1 Tax=Pseudomonas sp. NY15435 TaxID=3400358 RepID=UPI003A874571